MSFYGQQIFDIPSWLLKDGTINTALLPQTYDGVIAGYYIDGEFYQDSAANSTVDFVQTAGKIYVDLHNDKHLYIWQKDKGEYIRITKAMTSTDEHNDGNVVVEYN